MKYYYQLGNILNKKQKKEAIYLTFLTFVATILEVISLNFLLVLLGSMSGSASFKESEVYIFLKNLNLAYDLNSLIIFSFILVFCLKTFFFIFKSWKENKFINFTRAHLSHNFFKGYLYMPRIFHLRSNTSDLIKNITEEVNNITIAVQSSLIIIMESVLLSGIFIFLLFINFKLTLACFLALIFFSFFMSMLNQTQITQKGKQRVTFVQHRLKSIIEGLTGSKIYELTGSQQNVLNDFDRSNTKLAELSHNVNFRNTLPRPAFELFVLLLVATIFLLIYRSNSQLHNIVPTMGVFLAAAYRLIPSFSRIIENIQKFQYHIQAADKLSRDVEKFESKASDSNLNISRINFKNEIDFKKVCFSYHKNINRESSFVLKDMNFKIKKGSKIGIHGVSGSGKSTFLDLLMGLIEPQAGEILIDGDKIKKVKSGWQKVIGCVPQDVFILDDTITRNIAFGVEDSIIDLNKVKKSVDLASLTEFVNNSKFSLDTLLGERGARLSGGQRQRIGIARALYNEPDILIFDEATNALDEETEKKIVKEIFNYNKDKTIIFVSHNKNNLLLCDLIYEVKNKNLVRLK